MTRQQQLKLVIKENPKRQLKQCKNKEVNIAQAVVQEIREDEIRHQKALEQERIAEQMAQEIEDKIVKHIQEEDSQMQSGVSNTQASVKELPKVKLEQEKQSK